MSERALRFRITGRVQGVGFRAFTAEEATKRNLQGWVRNEEDGSVSAVASGHGAALAELIAALRVGPPAASVDSVDAQSTNEAAARELPPGAHRF